MVVSMHGARESWFLFGCVVCVTFWEPAACRGGCCCLCCIAEGVHCRRAELYISPVEPMLWASPFCLCCSQPDLSSCCLDRKGAISWCSAEENKPQAGRRCVHCIHCRCSSVSAGFPGMGLCMGTHAEISSNKADSCKEL